MCYPACMNLATIFGFLRRGYCRACLCAGPCFLAIALGCGVYTTWFSYSSVAANGTVVSMRTVTDAQDNSVIYAPVFTFAASDGNTYTISSDTGSNPPGFEPKQQVKVRYEKNRPTNAKIASFGQLWLFPIVFGIIGATATAVGYFLLRYERRRNPKFKLFPFGLGLPAALLGGPKVDGFEIERSRDTGRHVDL
jgi:hypothetical protein